MNEKIKKLILLIALGLMTPAVGADTQADENLRNAEAVYKRLQEEKQKEQLRDKSHDFPRVKVDEDTSIGVDPSKGQINIRKTTP